MAKKSRNSLVTVAFNYLVKTRPNDDNPSQPIDEGFREIEFQRVVDRLSADEALDESDPEVVRRIKAGTDLPFSGYEEVEPGLYFGNFDGAYYGQQYRNNVHGLISADSLNLRPFNYLITRLRDGKILIGTTYHGNFGDYDGLRSCLMHILDGNYKIASRVLKSISGEIGGGVPTEIRLSYRKVNDRPERRSVFGTSGAIAIKATEFGDGFENEVGRIAANMRGPIEQRKAALANLVSEGDIIELDGDDIIGCTAIVREERRTRTVYFLGDNNFATRFPLNVRMQAEGLPHRDDVRDEIIRVMRDRITPLLV